MTPRYRRTPGSLHRDLGAAVVVLPPAAEAPLVLRGGAAHVWGAVEEPVERDALVAALAAEVGGEPDAIGAVVDQLVAGGVIEPGP